MIKQYFMMALAAGVLLLFTVTSSAQSAYDTRLYLKLKIDYFGSIIKSDPKNAVAYAGRGYYEYEIKNYNSSLADFNKAISLDPDYLRAYMYRALVYKDMGEPEKARSDFEKALKLDSKNLSLNSAYLYHHLGQDSMAIELMDRFLREDYQRNLYDAACLYSLMGNEEKSIYYLKCSVETGAQTNFRHLMTDRDLDNIRVTEGYREVLEMALSATTNLPKFSSEYIRGYIDGKNNCKSVVLSNAGTIAIAKGQVSWNKIPDALVSKIREVYTNIIDVVLKSDGSWLVLYDTRKYAHSGNVPAALINRLDSWAKEGTDAFESVDWDNKGNWVAITDKHFTCVGDFSTEKISANIKQYGQLHSVCLDESGRSQFFCYTNGYNYYGVPPEGLTEKLDALDYHPRRIIVWGTRYFFASEDGSKYSYSM